MRERPADGPLLGTQENSSQGIVLRNSIRVVFCKENQLIIMVKVTVKSSLEMQLKISDAGTVYNFDTTDVDGKPEAAFICLKRLVGERILTSDPWSRTRSLRRALLLLIFQDLTVYKFFYSDSRDRLKNGSISLKDLVSAVEIEPSTY
jgi:hypothetical protein